MSLAALPHNHRRSVAVALRLMLERLEEVEGWLRRGGYCSPLREVVDDLSGEAKADVLARIASVRPLIFEALGDLDLPAESFTLRQMCMGTLGLTWEVCPDLRPERMTGYGPVPEALQPELRTLALELEEKMLALEAALGPLIAKHPPPKPFSKGAP